MSGRYNKTNKVSRLKNSKVNKNAKKNKSRKMKDSSSSDFQSCSEASCPASSDDDLPDAIKSSKSSLTSSDEGPTTSRPMTPGMSKNVASTLNQMRSSLDNLDNPDLYCEPKINILPSESHLSSVNDSESLFNDSQRATPKQVFPHISCLPFENNVVFCFILSVWDNIVGPQTVFVWKKRSVPSQKNFDELLAQENQQTNHRKNKTARGSSLGLSLGAEENRRPSIAVEVTDSTAGSIISGRRASAGAAPKSSRKKSSVLSDSSELSFAQKELLNVASKFREGKYPLIDFEEVTDGVDPFSQQFSKKLTVSQSKSKNRRPSVALEATNDRQFDEEVAGKASSSFETPDDRKQSLIYIEKANDYLEVVSGSEKRQSGTIDIDKLEEDHKLNQSVFEDSIQEKQLDEDEKQKSSSQESLNQGNFSFYFFILT